MSLEIPTKRVLIVDDEHVITDTLVTIFCNAGYEAGGVYSAEEALSLIDYWRPQMAVIDIQLPGMNGVDLAIFMKAQCPECNLVLFSGHGGAAELVGAAAQGGHPFNVLGKPVHPSELLGIAYDVFDGDLPN
jgi:DNA-binding NtrC family response regulator